MEDLDMKKCPVCGCEVPDDAQVCPKCGYELQGAAPAKGEVVSQPSKPAQENKKGGISTLKTVALVFMILSCIGGALCFLIPLAWILPMTISYNRKINNHEPVSIGFKVCTLIFVSLIAGILMLVDNED